LCYVQFYIDTSFFIDNPRLSLYNLITMSRRDIYHDAVRHALEKDSWTITHDPYPLEIGGKNLAADLGAERLISATKGKQQIVVEIKSFVGQSDVHDLQQAIGQYDMYWRILKKRSSTYQLYLAVRETTYETVFTDELGQLYLENNAIKLIVFNEKQEVITQWID